MGFFSNLWRPFFVEPRIATALRARRTSASRAIASGEGTEVRIVGRIDPSSAPFPAPFTGEPCVFWFVCVQRETDTGMNRSSGKFERYWVTSVRDASREPLVVIEDDGEFRVHVDLGSSPEPVTEGGARGDALARAPFLLDLRIRPPNRILTVPLSRARVPPRVRAEALARGGHYGRAEDRWTEALE